MFAEAAFDPFATILGSHRGDRELARRYVRWYNDAAQAHKLAENLAYCGDRAAEAERELPEQPMTRAAEETSELLLAHIGRGDYNLPVAVLRQAHDFSWQQPWAAHIMYEFAEHIHARALLTWTDAVEPVLAAVGRTITRVGPPHRALARYGCYQADDFGRFHSDTWGKLHFQVKSFWEAEPEADGGAVFHWWQAGIREPLISSLSTAFGGNASSYLANIDPAAAARIRASGPGDPDRIGAYAVTRPKVGAGWGRSYGIDNLVGGRRMHVATAALVGAAPASASASELAQRVQAFRAETIFVLEEILAGRDPYPKEEETR